jgi:tetratricopeptide repeat protein
MNIAWQSRNRKIFLAAALLLVLVYLGSSFTEFLADKLASSPQHLQMAARLQPGNAHYRHLLGRLLMLGGGADFSAAITQLRASVDLNSRDSDPWFDLARAYRVTGDSAAEHGAVEGALRADPTKPEAAWEAATFFLVRGEGDRALQQYRVVMENDPYKVLPAIEMCWRLSPNAQELLRSTIPARSDSYAALLGFLLSREQPDDAAQVWSRLIELGRPFESRAAYGYVNYLLIHRKPEEAAEAWQQMAPLCNLTAYLPFPRNLIVNPRFDLDVLNQGFDWRYYARPHVTLTLDPNEFQQGNRSISVAFDGQPVNDAGLFQFIAVQPDTSYDFNFYFKARDIEGAGGPKVVIQEAYANSMLFQSGELRDNNSWRKEEGSLHTGPETRLVVVRVVREPAGSPIRGTLWLDAFSLSPK